MTIELVTQTYLEEKAVAIELEQDSIGQSVVNMGNHLLDVKERVDHGQFTIWVEERLGWERTMAHRCMRVATQFSNVATLQHFDKSALFLLAAPSTPEPAREEAKERASFGKQITHKEAKQIIVEHKGTAKPKAKAEPKPEPVKEPKPVIEEQKAEVDAPTEPPVGAPTKPKPLKLPTFEQAWAELTKLQRDKLDSFPGSKHYTEKLFDATIALVTSLNS